MKLAGIVFLILLLLSGLSLYLSVGRLWEANQKLEQNVQLAALAEVRSRWYEGTVALSFERSVTQVALALDDTIPAAFREVIDQQRQASDTLIEQALRQIENQASFENSGLFLADSLAAREAISQLRTEADAMLALPSDQRNPERASQMPYELKSQIENLFAVANYLVLSGGQSSTQEMALSSIQSLSWETREYGGRARTFYAIATLTGQPIPEALMGEAVIDTARAKAAWHQLDIRARSVALPAALMTEIQSVEEPFVQTYFAALDRLDAAMVGMRLGDTVEMPFSFEDFFALSNTGLDAVADLAPKAGVHIQSFWAETIAESKNVRLVSALKVVILLLLTMTCLVALQRKIIGPLTDATDVLKNIADGNLERDFRDKKHGIYEISIIWRALEKLTLVLRDARTSAAEEKEADKRAKEGIVGELMTGLARVAEGDLTYKIKNEHGPAYEELVTNYNASTEVLRGLVADVVRSANGISQQSGAIQKAIQELSHRTESQSENLSQAVVKLDNFSEAIQGTAVSAEKSSDFVNQATDKANTSSAIVHNAVLSMERLSETSGEINQFTNVIDNIAFQTGLLALNAGVEAARAGEVGRGFSVVAQEVRTLAQSASQAAEQIKGTVDNSTDQITKGVENVGNAGDTIREIVGMIEEIRSNVSEISTASRNQTSGVNDISEMMNQLRMVNTQNSQMVEETTEIGVKLQEDSKTLRDSVNRFIVDENAGSVMTRNAA